MLILDSKVDIYVTKNGQICNTQFASTTRRGIPNCFFLFDHTGYRNLNTILEEGICQVLGYMWLESQRCSTNNAASSASFSSRITPSATISKIGDQSDFEKNLVEFCINQIETDESAVYGDGFKKVNEMMVSNHYNLMDTLKDIDIASKTLPAGRENNSKSNL